AASRALAPSKRSVGGRSSECGRAYAARWARAAAANRHRLRALPSAGWQQTLWLSRTEKAEAPDESAGDHESVSESSRAGSGLLQPEAVPTAAASLRAARHRADRLEAVEACDAAGRTG